MNKIAVASVIVAFLAGLAVLQAQTAPQKEHEWLQQLVGDWECDSEAVLAPGQPAVKSKGTENVRAVGGLWVVAEIKGTTFDTPFTGMMTLGYDAQKKKYIGTWIDSMNGHLVIYDGAVDEAGKTLTLLTEAPNPLAAGKLCKFKDVFEIKSKDHKVLTSSMQGDDGKWVAFLTVNYRRKK
jgi:hypothetical protein